MIGKGFRKLIPARLVARWNLTFGPAPPPLDREAGFSVEELSDYLQSKLIEVAPCPLGEDIVQCSICLEEMKEGTEAVQLDCQHLYHTECVKLWFYRKDSCPLCKKICKGVPKPREHRIEAQPPINWEMMTFGLDAPIILDFAQPIPHGANEVVNIAEQIMAD